ncbi:MAG: biotin/lipoyl-containing protein [Nitrospirota bacterium]
MGRAKTVLLSALALALLVFTGVQSAKAAAVPPAKAADASAGKDTKPGIRLVWKAPTNVDASKIAGYDIFRSSRELGSYKKINKSTVTGLVYEDKGLQNKSAYFYEICTVMQNGAKSKPTKPVGIIAGTNEPYVIPEIQSFTSDASGQVEYAGDKALFILNGTPGKKAAFDIKGLLRNRSMKEITPGVYQGAYAVARGVRVKDGFASATLSDNSGGKAAANTNADLNFLGRKKPALSGVYTGILESDRVGINWPRSASDTGYFKLYRDVSRIVGTRGLTPLSSNINTCISSYIDDAVKAGSKYYYVLAFTDPSGEEIAISDNLEVNVPAAGHVSGIDSVAEDSGGKTLKPGDTLTVTVKTSPGGKAAFGIGDAVREGALTEGPAGIYKGAWTVKQGDGTFKNRVAVSFRAADGSTHFTNSATFVSVDAPMATAKTATGKKPVARDINDDIAVVLGPSGRLTAGKKFDVTIDGDPGNKAYFCLGDGICKVPMKEETPGVYKGSYTVKPGDSAGTSGDPLQSVYLAGYLEGPGGMASDPVKAPAPVVVDTSCNIAVQSSISSLPADGKSQAKITFVVTDADGQPVKDRRLTIMLEPPPEYTGTAGSGAYQTDISPSAQKAEIDLLGTLRADFDNLTDNWGKMTATYTSGIAAKTAMVVARDYSTGSVGMTPVITGISSSVSVKLISAGPSVKAMAMALAPAYTLQLKVTPDFTIPGGAGGADEPCMTADGVSRANVVATLTSLSGKPVQGKTVVFIISGAGGRLNHASAATDAAGRAQVFYIAGTKAGETFIAASEASTGSSGNAEVLLLADAPARIYPAASPDELPADGVSSSKISVKLADVNGNPTEGVQVSMTLDGGPVNGAISGSGGASGTGSSAASGVTGTGGEADFTYTAGQTAGTATMEIQAASRAPTAEELKAALYRVVAPMVYDNGQFTELTVKTWLKGVGDRVGKGEPLAVVGTPLGDMTVRSPATGTLDNITVGQGFNVMEGKEIGTVK